MSPAVAAIVHGMTNAVRTVVSETGSMQSIVAFLTPTGPSTSGTDIDWRNPKLRTQAINELRIMAAHINAKLVFIALPDYRDGATGALFYVETPGASWLAHSPLDNDGTVVEIGDPQYHKYGSQPDDGCEFHPLLVCNGATFTTPTKRSDLDVDSLSD